MGDGLYTVAIEGDYIIGPILRGKLLPFVIPGRGLVKVNKNNDEPITVEASDSLMGRYWKIYDGKYSDLYIAEK